MDGAPTVNDFVVRLLELTHATLEGTVEGLSGEQLWYRPAPDANSIVWLAWHYSRWMDGMTAKAVGEEPAWTAGGWHDRFGLPAEANGYGDTPEQVGEFKPAKDLLMGYAQAAHDACVRRVQSLTPDDILQPFQYHARSSQRPLWQPWPTQPWTSPSTSARSAYVRGLLSGYGWR